MNLDFSTCQQASDVCLHLRNRRGFFEGVCGRDDRPLDSLDPPPPIRESSPASASRRHGERGKSCVACPALSTSYVRLRHKLVYVVVVAVLDARADASGPRGPEAVADPAPAEGGHAR
jgi:hypothetical protein